MFADLLQALIYALGGGFCLFVLYGFWRGLGLRPHRPGHGPSSESKTYWGAAD
jgi:hypothetical protein